MGEERLMLWKTNLKNRWVLWLCCLLLGSCQVHLDDYQGTQPKLDLKQFFTGKLKAYGMVQNRSGQVTRHFTADLVGTWKGDEGVLDEVFYFNDGEVQTRVWRLTQQPDGSYVGTAGDVIGQAEGGHQGFAFHWNYTLAVNVDDAIWHIDMDDWMYMITPNRLINQTQMSKWGIHVGQVSLVIEKKTQ
jgi:hypothetical protein